LLLQKYEKPRVREDAYKDLLMYNRKVFNARQTEALRGLYLWRNGVARQQDESTGSVVFVFYLPCVPIFLLVMNKPVIE